MSVGMLDGAQISLTIRIRSHGIWHAQDLETWQELLNITNDNDWPNLFIVLDPN